MAEGRRRTPPKKAASKTARRVVKKAPVPKKSVKDTLIEQLLDKAFAYKRISSDIKLGDGRKKILAEEISEILSNGELQGERDQDGKLSIAGEFAGEAVRVTLVEGTNIIIDEDKLREIVGADVWQQLTVETFSAKLLEDAIANGIVDPKVLPEVTTEEPRKSFPKVT